MQRTENEMAGETRVGGDACSFEIANLADHNDIRRLAQDGTQRGRKRHTNLRIHLHLIDPRHLILDRLLDGDDFTVGFIDAIETSIKRGRFAGAGGPGHQQNAIRQSEQTLEGFLVVRKKSKLWQSKLQA